MALAGIEESVLWRGNHRSWIREMVQVQLVGIVKHFPAHAYVVRVLIFLLIGAEDGIGVVVTGLVLLRDIGSKVAALERFLCIAGHLVVFIIAIIGGLRLLYKIRLVIHDLSAKLGLCAFASAAVIASLITFSGLCCGLMKYLELLLLFFFFYLLFFGLQFLAKILLEAPIGFNVYFI